MRKRVDKLAMLFKKGLHELEPQYLANKYMLESLALVSFDPCSEL